MNMSSNIQPQKSSLEELFEKWCYTDFFETWVENFALNLNDIWQENSAKDLMPINSDNENSAIVIGRGPSITKHSHLKKLANSNFSGTIICTDGSLISCLNEGVTPDKFPNFYVVSIDTHEGISKLYDDEIVRQYGKKINGIFSTVVKPSTHKMARSNGIKIHWVHSLFDYNEGKKSFNKISALMTRARNHKNGLPGIQTGGNVGTACWFIGWRILKASKIGLIGIDHSWNEKDSWKTITTHGNEHLNTLGMIDIDKNSPKFKKLFPKIYNPDFDCYCILDPIFQYYSNALKEFIKMSPEWLQTINATEGGCIFGPRIKSMTFEEFLNLDR